MPYIRCFKCGANSGYFHSYGGYHLCHECYEKASMEEIDRRAEYVKEAKDFKEWNGRDLSEIFWIELGRYQKYPNKRSINLMKMAYMWAMHDNHTLSNSITHALEWCKIDIFKESRRTDLPERFVEERKKSDD